ncbi:MULTISPECIES: hypothetical protein [Streptomyces]|uniref:Uncharacterized protein n=2 Tax=Streptomyces rimosus subsp. rimosus TaxID=132474 RepID=A0A8A1UNN6_STRR1|nr:MULTISPECIES: hypothetical protein [Streptomyces]MYT46725.1 hypothetical protein [Streptomyces sp. SID5471]QGY65519.1 hypothetical protein V519_006040 [Streptomyces rimosus R6-500]QST82446.1 hypothetical protein SRIM_021810 [Streptomyces rimosus subsp. rimosus ATCC 10970]QTL87637.1 hypothetical protein FMM49_19515 [Streptomyces rimosus subsp. rimosus]UNZ04255.1 hypothetical protein SRIMR7_19035 [Streptomyces rimosus subsp. rimosus]
MTQPAPAPRASNEPTLKPAALRLLREIARADTGQGVVFMSAPCGRWRLDGTAYVVADRTFHPLDAAGYVDVGNGRTDPVRITHAGRAHLGALDARAAA